MPSPKSKAAAANLHEALARIATLEALVASLERRVTPSLQAQLSATDHPKAPKSSSRTASFTTWGVRSLVAVIMLVSLPLMARGATIQVTGAGYDGSPSPPMIQFSDATGNLAATLTGSASAITSSTDLVTASGISLTELNATVETLLTSVALLQTQMGGPMPPCPPAPPGTAIPRHCVTAEVLQHPLGLGLE